MSIFQPIEIAARQLCLDTWWLGNRVIASWRDPAAVEYCDSLLARAYMPDDLVKVVPSHGLVYVVVPKAACTRIRMTLGSFVGRHSRSLNPRRRRNIRGPRGLRTMSMTSFYRLATSPETLRFSFTRNPYARLVSLWAGGGWDAPLVRSQSFINTYLAVRAEIDPSLPVGHDSRLSFPEFVKFITATARRRLDPHWQLQEDLVFGPGLPLDFIGKVESFDRDIGRIYDHVGADEEMRRKTSDRLNASLHRPWWEYYSADLADAVYRAYEPDFDRFGYPRTLPR
jgi:hypothetical protein